MLVIKNASVADIPAIRSLTMQVWPQTYIPIIGEQQVSYMLDLFYKREELEKQMETLGHQFIICYNDGVPVAFASFSEISAGIYKLHKIYVVPAGQGRGTGSYLINHIVAVIKNKNAKELRLNVNRYNLSAISFYKKTGFQHILDEDIDIGNGYFMNDHVLGLNIDG